jgi:4-amino-4-deoxy-L-arabinose transferase-like glycosyltransferase
MIAILWFYLSALFWIFSFLGKGDIRVDGANRKVDKESISIAQFHNDVLRFVFIISIITGLFVIDFIEEKNSSLFSFSYNFGQLLVFSLFFVFIYFLGRWKLKNNGKDKNRIKRGIIIWAILLTSFSFIFIDKKNQKTQLYKTSSRQDILIDGRNIGDIEGIRMTTE